MTGMTPPLSLYVHLPWCVRKCPYCDFNSHAVKEHLPVEAYLQALGDDLAAQAPAVAGREVISVFLGGGTPSLFPPAAIDSLLARVRAGLTLAPAAEVTMEANPGTIERGRFAEYRAAGINRVSLGAQSFAAAQLQQLGRIHSADETRIAAQELHAAGIDNFNLDLMVGLPGQDTALACADVRAALELEPAHLSHYQLTLEPGTVFGSLPPAGLPDHDAAADMQQRCHELLAEAGFARYETSAFARAGRRCLHNLNYWTFGDYLGVGAGAHGKRSDMVRQRIERTTREREPRRYMSRGARGLAPSHVIRASELPFEFMMNALRLTDGFATSLFEQRTGQTWNVVQPHMMRLAARGLAVEEPAGHWRASDRGAPFLNELLLEFMDMPRASRPGLSRKTPEGPAA
jgi:putative oxygen-independent coproporphyrinogen III oxidase